MCSQYVLLLTISLLGCGLAKPAAVFLGYQDSLGQYSFGYSAPGSARSEVRTLNGATRGAYSYVDGNGIIQIAKYTADSENGFRVVATNLPEAPLPVEETPEVAAARLAHLQALQQAQEGQSEPEAMIESKNSLPKDGQTNDEIEKPAIAKDESIITKNIPNAEIESNEKKQKIGEEEKAKSNDAVEVTAARSSQINNSHVAAVPVIHFHLISPAIVDRTAVPIYKVAQGDLEIEPSNLEESLTAQARSITPAGTALKSEGDVGPVATRQSPQENSNAQEEKDVALKTIIAPSNLIPLGSSFGQFVRYAPAVSYITYPISL